MWLTFICQKKLPNPNYYDVLGVTNYATASKGEITEAMKIAMKRRQYSLALIAQAQRSLLKPETRILADYLRPILPNPVRFRKANLSILPSSALILDLSPEFVDLDEAIANIDDFFSLEML